MKHVAVLSGGGAKGCDQVGRLLARSELGDQYDAIVGTSVGALNAFMMSRLGVIGLAKTWRSIAGLGEVAKKSWWSAVFSDGLYDMAPLKKRLEQMDKERPAKTPYWACYTDLRDFSVHYGKSVDSVMASASIPAIHKPVMKYFVDGGAREHAPIGYAINDLQADIVSVFITYPPKETVIGGWEPTKAFKTYSYLERGVDALSHDVAWNDIEITQLKNEIPRYKKVELRVYAPSSPIGLTTMEFDPAKIAHYMNKAYSEERAKEKP